MKKILITFYTLLIYILASCNSMPLPRLQATCAEDIKASAFKQCLGYDAIGSIKKITCASSFSQPRMALIIGNAAYPKPYELYKTHNDAWDMAHALCELGFHSVWIILDASRPTILQAFSEFQRAREQQGAIAVFYFSGHGMQVRGKNYLLPTGHNFVSDRDVEKRAIAVETVLQQMEQADTANILLIDACRDNPFWRGKSWKSKGLAPVELRKPKANQAKGSIIAFATAPGQIALEGEGRNSIFTGELLQQMQTPGLQFRDLLDQVGSAVENQTGGKQKPVYWSSLRGHLYLERFASSHLWSLDTVKQFLRRFLSE